MIRTETNKSPSSSTSSSNLKRKFQDEKDKEYVKKRKREFQENLLVDFPWLRCDDKADNRATDNQRICVFTQLKSANTQLKLNSSVLKSIGNRHLRTRISVYAYRISKVSQCRVFDCTVTYDIRIS